MRLATALLLAVTATPTLAGARQDARVIMPENAGAKKMLEDWGFSEAVVAIDGSKFKAVNTRDKNFTPAKVIEMATVETARGLKLHPRVGELRAGAAADCLVVAGDPILDIEALRRPELVIASGRAHIPQGPDDESRT